MIRQGYKNRLIEELEFDIDDFLVMIYENIIASSGGLRKVINEIVEGVLEKNTPIMSLKENIDKEKLRIGKARKRFAESLWLQWAIAAKELEEKGSIDYSTYPEAFKVNYKLLENRSFEKEIETFKNYYYEMSGWYDAIKICSRMKNRKDGTYRYIAHYPWFEHLSLETKIKYFKMDMEDNIIYLLNLDKYVYYTIASPDSLQSSSLFVESDHYDSSFRKQYKEPEAEENNFAFPVLTEDVDIDTSIGFDTPYYPDERGKGIIRSIFTHCLSSYMSTNSFVAVGTLTDVCKIIWPKKKVFSSSDYETAERELWNIRFWGISEINENGSKVFRSIFDELVIQKKAQTGEENKTRHYQVKLGAALSRDIVSQQYQLIVMNVLNKLENNIAKLLFETLSKDRIYDLTVNAGVNNSVHIYQTLELQMIARVKGGKKKVIDKYQEAFNEFQEKRIFINSYIFEGEHFRVTWMPFTESEKADIIPVGTNHMIDNLLEVAIIEEK